MTNILQLITLIPGYRGRFFRVILVNLTLGLGTVATPYLYKQIVDGVVALSNNPEATHHAKTLVLGSLGIIAFIRLITVVLNYFQERASDSLFFETMWGLRKQIFVHLTKLSIDYYEQHRVGEIVQRITYATGQLRSLLQQWAEGALLSLLTLIFIIAILLIQLPAIGVLMLIMVPAMLLSAIYRIRKTQPLQRQWLKLAEKTTGTLSETISLISTIRSFGRERDRIKLYNNQTDDFRALRFRHFRIEWNLNALQSLVVSATSLTALAIVAFGALSGKYTAGDILLVLTYTQMIVSSIMPIVRLIINTGEVEIAAERVVELLQVDPAVLDVPGARKLQQLQSIEFKNVSFKYPGSDKIIIKDISFTLKAGQTLALVGPSGVGKTTITKLILRFYEPSSGHILINGQDIKNYTQDSLRETIGLVMQDVALFNDTVKANLIFSDPAATVSQWKSAAKLAYADGFIDRLPQGYDTLVGERGVKLSGGEKQRLGIARAILRKPQLIILDEATSALDSESEQYVQAGLKNLMSKRTAIVIAHRLSTVRQADHILVFQNGEIIQTGTHKELANKEGSLYAKLYQLQTQGILRKE